MSNSAPLAWKFHPGPWLCSHASPLIPILDEASMDEHVYHGNAAFRSRSSCRLLTLRVSHLLIRHGSYEQRKRQLLACMPMQPGLLMASSLQPAT